MELLALIGILFLCYFLSKALKRFSQWCHKIGDHLTNISVSHTKVAREAEKVHSRSLEKSFTDYKGGISPDAIEQVKTTLNSSITVEDFLRSNLFNKEKDNDK